MAFTLYLMRHGQTDWNADERMQGSHDTLLNDVGIAQATKVAPTIKALDLTYVYVSPLKRAQKTAQLATGLAITDMTVDPRLREICYGSWEGQRMPDLGQVVVDFFEKPHLHVPPEGAESYEDLLTRCRALLDDLCTQLPDGSRALLVSHGATLHGVLVEALHLPLNEFWRHNVDNCTVTRLCYDGKEFTL